MFLLLGMLYAHGSAQEPTVFDGGGNSKIISTHPVHGRGDFKYAIFKNGYSLWNRWGQLTLTLGCISEPPLASELQLPFKSFPNSALTAGRMLTPITVKAPHGTGVKMGKSNPILDFPAPCLFYLRQVLTFCQSLCGSS